MNKKIIYGAMGLGGPWEGQQVTAGAFRQAEEVLDAAIECGIRTIDTADIYRAGKSETVIGAYLKSRPSLRKELCIQSKLGIQLQGAHFGSRFNFSYDYIMKSIEAILTRLHTDYVDVLFLHRPDPLMQRDELYKALDELFSQGLIKALGVSNMNRDQMELIEAFTGRRISANQLELSLEKHQFATSAVGFNNQLGVGTDFPIGTIEYCMLKDFYLQAWSPLARGLYSGRELGGLDDKNVLHTRKTVTRIAKEYGVSAEAVVLAWLFRHPAGIQPVIGTTNIKRIRSCTEAFQIDLTRDQWYELLVSAAGKAMP
jgi:predicted oxidoreductase